MPNVKAVVEFEYEVTDTISVPANDQVVWVHSPLTDCQLVGWGVQGLFEELSIESAYIYPDEVDGVPRFTGVVRNSAASSRSFRWVFTHMKD